MILFKLIKYIFHFSSRNIYWFINVSRIKGISKCKLEFPLIIEGKGKIFFEEGSKIYKYVNIGAGKNANISFGNNSDLQRKCLIRVNENCDLTFGNGCLIGEYTKMYVHNNWQIGDNVQIQTNCVISAREPNCFGKLIIGSNTHIGDYTIIDVADNVSIGDNVALGPNCVLYTHDHEYDDPKLPAWKGGLKLNPVTISSGAWIGSGVTILPGVNIGERCVVAAGSVVTKNLKGNSVYGGIPAKLIKEI